MENIKIFSGRSHPDLAERVCSKLGISLGYLKLEEFRNGCFEPILKDEIEGKKVFLLQTLKPDSCDLHKDIWELLQMVNAAKESKAKEIIAVMPYNSYARSDKIYEKGMGICAELLIKLLETSGMAGFIGIDFHSKKLEKFFSVDTYQLSAKSLFLEALKGEDINNSFLLPADMGAFEKGSDLAKELGLPVGRVIKRRISDNKVEIENIEGDLKNKDIIVFDDEISTGTTLKTLSDRIEGEVRSITFLVTHGLFVGGATENFKSIKKLRKIIFTDTVPVSRKVKDSLPLRIISVDNLLSKKIREVSSY